MSECEVPSLLFSDLIHLPYDEFSAKISIDQILRQLPDTPVEVAQQFYADHGRKEDFQSQYGHLQLRSIIWGNVKVLGSGLHDINIYSNFRNWFDSVGRRAEEYSELGWMGIDTRRAVQQHWEKFGTWDLSPILIDGSFVNSFSRMHLIEGHTRIGLLSGLIRCGVVPEDSKHSIWMGSSY